MAFLKTVSDDEATGEIAELYRQQLAASGYIPDSTRVLTTRPDLLVLYRQFVDAVQHGFSLPMRDWRLITFVAACMKFASVVAIRMRMACPAVCGTRRSFQRMKARAFTPAAGNWDTVVPSVPSM